VPDSAGILLYRQRDTNLEVLVGHPGGPFWANKHEGAWSIPKGEIEPGEDVLGAAVRELFEETGARVDREGCVPIGEVRQKAGKVVAAWACPGDFDPDALTSNPFEMEWPPRSGRTQTYPELNRVQWCLPPDARRLLNAAQAAFVERVEAHVKGAQPETAEHRAHRSDH
jgi:predicted NUDIX family NTP pyrophosphohydrolase